MSFVFPNTHTWFRVSLSRLFLVRFHSCELFLLLDFITEILEISWLFLVIKMLRFRFRGFILIGLETIYVTIRARVKETKFISKTGFHFSEPARAKDASWCWSHCPRRFIFGESQTIEICVYGNSQPWSAVKNSPAFHERNVRHIPTMTMTQKRSVIRWNISIFFFWNIHLDHCNKKAELRWKMCLTNCPNIVARAETKSREKKYATENREKSYFTTP